MGPNRQPELYAAALIPYTAAAVALVLRLAARHKARHMLLWEDYLAIVAFLTGTAFTFVSVYKMRWGLGKMVHDIDMAEDLIVYHYFMDLFVDMWFYTFSIGLSKFVILGFYWRTFSSSIIRQPIRILFICSMGWIITRIMLISLQCQPIRKFWHKDVPGNCALTPMMSLFGSAIPHFILEVAILLCPIIEICRLHMPTTRKIAVAAMFASGLLVCGSALGSIIHTVSLDKKKTTDLTFDGIDDQIWAVCDVNLASFATSLPLLRPTLRSLGGVFSNLKYGSLHAESEGNTHDAQTFGSEPRRKRRHDLDTGDEVVEFADKGAVGGGRSQAFAMWELERKAEGKGDGIRVERRRDRSGEGARD
ncbi:hypothetical protein EJ02DRAFT_417756 [Clathrospora elynae]|uniref:Rhodopsin domain-containing protein n=1 Tax=Clathrospora elynae TaxID=706981 RepID=A0A6A5T4R1_9PLEO|nr:hypothetical protein EJ02DRAFT_417756 [Clathrospora elynae]